jgi:hypothetical protein
MRAQPPRRSSLRIEKHASGISASRAAIASGNSCCKLANAPEKEVEPEQFFVHAFPDTGHV